MKFEEPYVEERVDRSLSLLRGVELKLEVHYCKSGLRICDELGHKREEGPEKRRTSATSFMDRPFPNS